MSGMLEFARAIAIAIKLVSPDFVSGIYDDFISNWEYASLTKAIGMVNVFAIFPNISPTIRSVVSPVSPSAELDKSVSSLSSV